MGRWIAAWLLLTFGGVTSSAGALTADDYVVAARAALFERTYAGLLQVDDLYGAAETDSCCPDAAEDRELIFLHAVAQTAMLFVDYNDVLVAEDLFQLAEMFGIPLDGLVFAAGAGDDAGVRKDPCLRRPEMGAQKGRQTLREVVLPRLDVIIGNLDAIEEHPDPFVVYLVPEETGLAGDLEIDYGDVLILKSLLSAYRGLLATQCSEDADVLEADEACGRNALDVALAALVRPDENVAFLSRARDDWVAALSWCIAAAEHMAGENGPAKADPQEDEFVYIAPEAQRRVEVYQRTLAALRSCLVTGADAVEAVVDRKTYRLQKTDAQCLGELTLAFDLRGFEGTEGRLVLTDGTTLEIDWFGPLDDERIGVSLFSGTDGLEGWLEVALDRNQGLIHDGTLELWGRQSATLTGLAGEAVAVGTLSAQADLATCREMLAALRDSFAGLKAMIGAPVASPAFGRYDSGAAGSGRLALAFDALRSR